MLSYHIYVKGEFRIDKTASLNFDPLLVFTRSEFFWNICRNCGWSCDDRSCSNCDDWDIYIDFYFFYDNCGIFATIVVGIVTIVVDCNNSENCDNSFTSSAG